MLYFGGRDVHADELALPRTLTRAIARAGGFLGRNGDGDPGRLTIWRGWTRLRHQLIGDRLAAGKRSG
jgi:hypothetical protein